MILTKELARYILLLQSIAALERGLDEDELKIKNSILNNFPKIKAEFFFKEFQDWLWKTKVYEDKIVKEIDKLQNMIYKANSTFKDDEMFNL